MPFFIFKHSRAPKRSWKIFHGGPGKSGKSPGFFLVSKRVGTLLFVVPSFIPEFLGDRWCEVSVQAFVLPGARPTVSKC